MYRNEGPRALYSGLAAHLMKVLRPPRPRHRAAAVPRPTRVLPEILEKTSQVLEVLEYHITVPRNSRDALKNVNYSPTPEAGQQLTGADARALDEVLEVDPHVVPTGRRLSVGDTGYDFRNLVLDQLPYEPSCTGEEDGGTGDCPTLLTDASGNRLQFPLLAAPSTVENPDVDIKSCRLVNGLFRGRVVPTDQGFSCVPDAHASLRLVGVDYGDVQDATQNTVRQVVTIKVGISSDKAKEINKLIKAEAPKGVQSQVQGDTIRVSLTSAIRPSRMRT